VERINRNAILAEQPPYLVRVADRRLDLRLAQKEHRHPHIELFGDPNRAFCGEPLAGGIRRSRAPYSEGLVGAICPQCAEVIAGLMKPAGEVL
jgi:hypothetical protein